MTTDFLQPKTNFILGTFENFTFMREIFPD